jgi:hypothetical protein
MKPKVYCDCCNGKKTVEYEEYPSRKKIDLPCPSCNGKGYIEIQVNIEHPCAFCWKSQIDVCNYCQKGICEDHCKQFIGEKTKLEWYFCLECLKIHPLKEVLKEKKES